MARINLILSAPPGTGKTNLLERLLPTLQEFGKVVDGEHCTWDALEELEEIYPDLIVTYSTQYGLATITHNGSCPTCGARKINGADSLD